MEKKWILVEAPPLEHATRLAAELDIPLLIAKILLQRNITSTEAASTFLRPKMSDVTDPSIFSHMQKAVDRILTAIKENEHIMIHGDYDVDGVTSTSLLYLALKRLGARVSYYIPNRLNSGYGLSEQSVAEAVRRGCKVMITVDCGITASNEIHLAERMGIDTIVTDHHEVQSDNLVGYAIINPKLLPESSPAYYLAGVGVTFKLVQGLFYATGHTLDDLAPYLDLVAMGSVADLVPMTHENRVLSRFGIQKLEEGLNPGFEALMDITGLRGHSLTSGKLVFILAPRINAVGRLGDAQLAVRLFTTENKQQALNIARILEDKNRRRRRIDEDTFKEAVQLVNEKIDLDKTTALILASESWHQGVIGIVASRLVEKFYRPTIMISIDPETHIGKGSARSVEGFHLFAALKQCEEHLLGFGGHKHAAGLTIKADKIDAFREAMQHVAFDKLTEDDYIPKLYIDCEVDLDEINDALVDSFYMLSPFGPENMRPVFLSRGLEMVGSPSVVGTNHLKFRVRKKTQILEAIAYNMSDKYYDRLQYERPRLNLAYVIDENEWQGRRTLQLRIKGLKFNDNI